MRKAVIAFTLLAGLAVSAAAQTPAPAPAAPPYSVATTTIGELLDHPALKAIFEKYLPDIANNERINEGRALTLQDIVQYVPDQVTPDKLAAIDLELKALPPQ